MNRNLVLEFWNLQVRYLVDMYIFKNVAEIQQYLNECRSKNAAIGFTPTMGALHEGHLSLVRRAVTDNEISVCSIFVNPTQFDDKADLDRYPRTMERDLEMLKSAGNHVVFAPTADEVYPKNLDTSHGVDFGAMADHMEGAHRPGHFDGMAQVVKRLVDIVESDYIYMGQKDYQQQALVKYMFKQLNYKTQVVTCPIVREADGLAMSSRNRHLNTDERESAGHINKVLRRLKEVAEILPLSIARNQALEQIRHISGADSDYLEIVDAVTLERLDNFEDAKSVVACTTVRIGKVRLLDNMILR